MMLKRAPKAPERRRRTIKRALDAIDPPPLVALIPRRDTENILDKIDPPATKRRMCQAYVIGAVRLIHATDSDLSPGRLKSQYEAVATLAKKLDAALVGLPVRSLFTSIELNKLTEECRDQADRIIVKRGGGKLDERHDAKRKRIALDCARKLLQQFSDQKTTKRHVNELADLLFKAATGRDETLAACNPRRHRKS
jgi:hypothetical protein